MDLLPPPTTETYFSLEDLTAAFNTFAGSQGYAVLKQRTKKSPKTNLVMKAYFRCDRGGKPDDVEHGRKRKHSATRLIDCPFSCFALNKQGVGWILVVREAAHNHSATSEGSHPTLRKMAMTSEVKASIETQIKSQATSSQVLTSLRLENEDCILNTRDIYNVKAAIRRKGLGPLSPIQYFLQNLERDNWYFQHRTTEISKEVTHLFFVEKNSFEILKNNSEVLLMNCTYKTNKYKLPLLVIVGHTALRTTFYVGFAFVVREQEEDFVWVLTALKDYFIQVEVSMPEVLVTDRDLGLIRAIQNVFPDTAHLLCIWHVNKNVLAHCKPAFSTSEAWKAFYSAWHTVIQAPTTEAFDTAWNQLKDDYYVEYFELIDYLKNTWLRIFARKIIKCYINKIRHFMTTTTSQSESAHRMLKQQLRFSTEDLKSVVDKIEILLMNQRKEYDFKLEIAKMRVSFNLQIPLFRGLISHVTPYALQLIYKQYRLIQDENHSAHCTHAWKTISGLPCSHIIQERAMSPTEMLLLEDVHPHWRFVKLVPSTPAVIDPSLLVREPAVPRTRGRPMGSTIEPPNQADLIENTAEENLSTQRNPSQFEITKDIVPDRHQVALRGRVADRGDRARGRARGRGRSRGRNRSGHDRGRGRGGRGGRGGRIRDENGRWIRRTDELTNQETAEGAVEEENEDADN